MKLEIYTSLGWLPIVNKQKYCTEYEYDGTQCMSFDLLPTDEVYMYIKNEVLVRNDENLYIIKSINKRKTTSSITCEIYMDEWYTKKPYAETKELYQFKTKTLLSILDNIKPNGWSIINAEIRSIQRTIELQDATDYDVLMNCQSIFNVVYEINAIQKTVRIIDADLLIDTGLYITPQLNMKSLESLGDSKNFVTRISAFGKKNEDGTFVNFASINGGKDYVENTSYTGKTKWIIWRDDRYTIPENLLNDAKKKLEKQAFPVLSYTVSVNDLAQYDERYAFMNFQLYNLAHTVIDENTTIAQNIVKIKRYHDNSKMNEITLSTEAEKITSKVDKITTILGADGEKITGSILQQAQERATALINQWAEKGFIHLTQNEIYILDKLPKETAKFCIRMNLGGIAFSQNGWQGPYISAWTIDGRFNADFITAGVLRAINIEGTTIKGSTISGNSISGGSINGTTITNGNNFNVDSQGNMTAKNAKFSGDVVGGTITGDTTINVGTDLYVGDNIFLGNQKNGDTKRIQLLEDIYILLNSRIISINNGNSSLSLSDSLMWFNKNLSDEIIRSLLISDSHIDMRNETGLISFSNASGLFIKFNDSREANYINPGNLSSLSNLTVTGNLFVRGQKSRLVDTSLYGKILMNAVESAEAVFEDFGASQINDSGKIVIRIEDKFLATVNMRNDYYVFLSKCGEGDLFVKNKYNFAFVVQGTPNLKFDWRIVAKQRDYEDIRLNEFKKEGV